MLTKSRLRLLVADSVYRQQTVCRSDRCAYSSPNTHIGCLCVFWGADFVRTSHSLTSIGLRRGTRRGVRAILPGKGRGIGWLAYGYVRLHPPSPLRWGTAEEPPPPPPLPGTRLLHCRKEGQIQVPENLDFSILCGNIAFWKQDILHAFGPIFKAFGLQDACRPEKGVHNMKI